MSWDNQPCNSFSGCAVYMALVPFFFLILSKPQLILSNSKSRSTGQTQLIIRDAQECIKFDFFWQDWAHKVCRFSVLFGYSTK